jgi:hypothetical protein
MATRSSRPLSRPRPQTSRSWYVAASALVSVSLSFSSHFLYLSLFLSPPQTNTNTEKKKNALTQHKISSVNDPPVGTSATFQLDSAKLAASPASVPPTATLRAGDYYAQGIVVQLNATDVDLNFAPKTYYRVSSFPKFGKLFQLNDDNSVGEELVNKGFSERAALCVRACV